MLWKKGIVRKTFILSSLLIFFVIAVSFATLYYLMPRVYYNWKVNSLQNNLTALTQKLRLAADGETGAPLIHAFCEANNVVLFAFDGDGKLVPEMSAPFIGMHGVGNALYVSGGIAGVDAGRASFIAQGTGIPDKDAEMVIERSIGEAPAAIHGQDGISLRWSLLGGNPVNYISLDARVGTALVDSILVRGALQPIDEASGVILMLLPYLFGAAIILGLVLSGFYANKVSKPLLVISDAALSMQAMTPGVKSGIRTDDELGRLSSNLDALYANLLENIEELRSEMDEVNRLERSRTEMMQSASHELKTPITALGGMLEGMIDNVGPYKDRDKYLDECKTQADRLSILVNEILDASRQEYPEREAAAYPADVEPIITRALKEHENEITSKQLKVVRNYGRAGIVANQPELYRVLSNLISNAVRYAPESGEITVNLTVSVPSADGNITGAYILSVINDCNEPMSESELDKLTEPFYTRSFSRDREKSGTGLGLYIVKRALERQKIQYKLEYADGRFMFEMILPGADGVYG